MNKINIMAHELFLGFISKILVSAGIEIKVGDPILITVDDASLIPQFNDYKVESVAPAAVIPAPAPVQPIAVAPPKAAVVPPKPTQTPASVPPPVKSSEAANSIPVPLQLQQSIKWSSSSISASSPLLSVITKDQEAYIAKYGRSLHKVIHA